VALTVADAETVLNGPLESKPVSLIFASTEIARLPGWQDFFEKAARKTTIVILSSPFCRNDEFEKKPFLYVTKVSFHSLHLLKLVSNQL